MIHDRIKELRENAGLSQAQLAKKLGVTRSSVNYWEMGLSMPTIRYVIDMAKLFHVSADYILEIKQGYTVNLDGYTQEELDLVYSLIKYIDDRKENP